MVRPSCHGVSSWGPTARLSARSLRPPTPGVPLLAFALMGPEDLPSLLAGSAEVVPAEELERKLTLGRPLRVKLGLDPTAPIVTLGWAVVLHKLRQFQDAGHTAVLIVGDFTAQVGDPSGKTETRPRLSEEEVRGYAERLLDQFWRILDPERTEVRYNAEWLEPMSMEEILRLSASTTVARMLERDDFAKRYAEGKPISIMEFLYPLLQGMDSVAVEADVELGGRDQTFNLLVGRDLQREFDQEPQVALTTPLLVGTDGVQKMSQSLGNYIGITDPPDEMFGKLVRVPDELIATYRLLALDFFRDPTEAERVEKGLEDGSLDPWEREATTRARGRRPVPRAGGRGGRRGAVRARPPRARAPRRDPEQGYPSRPGGGGPRLPARSSWPSSASPTPTSRGAQRHRAGRRTSRRASPDQEPSCPSNGSAAPCSRLVVAGSCAWVRRSEGAGVKPAPSPTSLQVGLPTPRPSGSTRTRPGRSAPTPARRRRARTGSSRTRGTGSRAVVVPCRTTGGRRRQTASRSGRATARRRTGRSVLRPGSVPDRAIDAPVGIAEKYVMFDGRYRKSCAGIATGQRTRRTTVVVPPRDPATRGRAALRDRVSPGPAPS